MKAILALSYSFSLRESKQSWREFTAELSSGLDGLLAGRDIGDAKSTAIRHGDDHGGFSGFMYYSIISVFHLPDAEDKIQNRKNPVNYWPRNILLNKNLKD